MSVIKGFVASILIFAMSQVALAADKEFPGRDIHLGVPYIELADLQAQFQQVVLVDVRSKYEYDTLKITGAINIPLNEARFTDQMQQLRDDNKDRKIVVYCNGKSCMKSYKAASKCAARGIGDVVAFDAGVMDWAKASPGLSTLLGKPLGDAAKLISKSQFEAHLVEPTVFSALVQQDKTQVLDVRDRFQRSGMSLFIGAETQAGLDEEEKMNQIIKKAIAENTTLLIYDESGKQVRWLQYRLEEQGLKNYKFMQGGTREYFKLLKARMRG